jgi:hypothetical protein
MFGCDPDIAGKDKFDGAGAGIAIKPGDHDLRQRFDRVKSLVRKADQFKDIILNQLRPQNGRQNADRKAFGAFSNDGKNLDVGVCCQIARDGTGATTANPATADSGSSGRLSRILAILPSIRKSNPFIARSS